MTNHGDKTAKSFLMIDDLINIELTIGLMGLNPFRGCTGASGWKNVSPI